MARSALLSLASIGLFTGALVFSFMGCYGDVADVKGNCDDDGNPCTIDMCASGATVHAPAVDGETCALGANAGKCAAGSCQLDCLTAANGMAGACNCAADSECPTDELCATWDCTAGQCARTPKPDGVVDTLKDADCQHVVCEAGKANTKQDDADTEDDDKGDCRIPTCKNMAPNFDAAPLDIRADMPNDCKTFKCTVDGPGFDVNNMDAPLAMECVEFVCNSDGSSDPKNASKGQKCSTGACDGAGACKLEDGQACVNAPECLSGNCADGVCCNDTCTDECKSCALSGKVGTCTNILTLDNDLSYTDPVSMTPNVNCSAPFYCNGSGKCLGGFGAPCTTGSGCLGGVCAMPSKLCLGAKDEPCQNGGQCASGTCTMNKCT